MGTTSSIFAGNSRYAQDFQSVIDRAVAIASLPLKQYQNQQTRLQAESAEISLLSAKFTALGTALDRLSTAAGITASSSDATILTATSTSGAAKGTYTLDIRDAGSSAMSLSPSAGITDPKTFGLSASTVFSLTVKTDPGTAEEQTKTVSFSTQGVSLNDLRDAINAQTDLHAHATVVNVGTSAQADYRLSIQSTDLAPQTIQLNDGSKDLLTPQATGSRVTYRLNGGSEDFKADSRTLALADGLTINILAAKSGTPVTVSVGENASTISLALTSFANNYNALVDEIDKNHGSGGGALSGNALMSQLSSTLYHTVFYENGGTSLAQLGLTADKTGHLSLDAGSFDKAAVNLSQVTSFLGSATSGFISNAKAAFEEATGLTGSLTSASEGIAGELKAQDELIASNQQRVDDLQARLSAQMAASDALIAQLEQQATFFTAMFKAMAANSSQY